MKKPIILIAGLAGIFFVACSKKDQTTSNDDHNNEVCAEGFSTQAVDGRYIVAYEPNVINGRNATEASMEFKAEAILEEIAVPAERIDAVFGGEPGGFIARLTPTEANALLNEPSVRAVEPDRFITLSHCFTVAEPRLVTWNITRVGYGNGIGKTAWVIDTGVDFDHPDLNVDTLKSRSFISGLSTADDGHGHGTHVAGVIGGKNNTFGVLGVASGATIISLRVLNAEGTGTLSAIIQALAYVNQYARAGDVVNMSLGEDVSSPTLISQVQNTASRGIYIAIAAGNDGEAANKYSPANANGTNIYTVSAVDSTDKFASFSNYGNDVVDYAAPGVRILSTYTNGRYAYMSGTSMAAPHMAGLLLLKGSAITTSGYAVEDPDGNPDPIAHK